MIPFKNVEVQVDKDGKLVQLQSIQNATDLLAQNPGITDLLVMSHGWNNDIADARSLYDTFFTRAGTLLAGGKVPELAAAQIGVVTIFWPSKKFADADLIPGGAAGFDADDATADAIDRGHDRLLELYPESAAVIEQARKEASNLEDPGAQDRWVELLKKLLPADAGNEEEGTKTFLDTAGRTMFASLSKPILSGAAPRADGQGGAAGFDEDDLAARRHGAMGGEAAGLGDFLRNAGDAASKVLNLFTYYSMKARAGVVGHGAVNELLKAVQGKAPKVRIHLLGHSFGARVVTAAADGPGEVGIASMALLQAAFSHFGFAQNYDGQKHDGLFRRVVAAPGGRVRGPVLITHTVRDQAVGLAYAIASRVAGQIAADLGDANDPFGGLGRNGAQKTPEATDQFDLLEVGKTYTFAGGKVYNLKADDIILSHGDITEPQVLYAVLSAVGQSAALSAVA